MCIIYAGQYTVPGQRYQEDVLYEEILMCADTNLNILVDSNEAYGVTNTVTMEPETIDTNVNVSYHVTNRPSDGTDNEYYSVIPPDYQEEGIPPMEEMVSNEAYRTTRVQDKETENQDYDYEDVL